ncbi:MAG: hypothetical protein QOJ65_1137 [Fimbriimonadaceae bacterium]|jgi:hypothetical protein|nr:hypothetical protein [Fimbriimonadaceae bacterium]
MKNWYASKTIWAGVGVVVLAALNAATGVVRDPVVLSGIGVFVGFLKIVLRTVTGEAIK